MLNFILCDDDERHNIYMEKRIQKILSETNLSGEVVFHSTIAQEIIDYSNAHKGENNVYVLDIDFKEESNGVDLAKQIRKNEINAYIIYVSAHQEYSMLCYKTKTFDFLLKPINYEALKNSIISLYDDFEKTNVKNENFISVKSGSLIHMINLNDIIYIEKMGNVMKINTTKGLIMSYESLEHIQTYIKDSSLFRCHKSFIVNIKYIDYISVNENLVYMKNGDRCIVSRRYKKELLRRVKDVAI